ncbi:hypothetical protein [Halorubrum sp. F4]|uniref:hypothetical protein n=1 Tax=Halorubrum sp. F4 TaxID=2989715 RepID=UPI0024815E9C|nr:hypothetical protein [Halorubrum sp. F4]
MSDGADGEAARVQRAEFYDRYHIPFDHDAAIKVRRSGLLRGSSGTGHARDTVVHLHVKEPFSAGRLSRGADSYLCEKGSTVDFQGREERHKNDDGETVIPAVTCETCLDRMERWEVNDGQ